MKVHIDLDKEQRDSLAAMSEESALPIPFLVQVAVYNLIALWMQQREIHVEPSGAVDAVVVSPDSIG